MRGKHKNNPVVAGSAALAAHGSVLNLEVRVPGGRLENSVDNALPAFDATPRPSVPPVQTLQDRVQRVPVLSAGHRRNVL